jgi:uncharacterized Zn finger protein (UPF0148 family)
MYLYKEGVLVCSVCGKPAHKPEIEDKQEHIKFENKPEKINRRK